jgi:hypothetical protein
MLRVVVVHSPPRPSGFEESALLLGHAQAVLAALQA